MVQSTAPGCLKSEGPELRKPPWSPRITAQKQKGTPGESFQRVNVWGPARLRKLVSAGLGLGSVFE